jgi:hypothetical protein
MRELAGARADLTGPWNATNHAEAPVTEEEHMRTEVDDGRYPTTRRTRRTIGGALAALVLTIGPAVWAAAASADSPATSQKAIDEQSSTVIPDDTAPDPRYTVADKSGVDYEEQLYGQKAMSAYGDGSRSFTFPADEQVADGAIPGWLKGLPSYEASVAQGVDLAGSTFYDDGAIVAIPTGATAAANDYCPYHFVCVWEHSSFRGRWFRTARTDYIFCLNDYGLGDEVSSWRNASPNHEGSLYRDTHGNGPVYWMPERHMASHMGSWNDEASSLRLWGDQPAIDGCPV